MKKFITAILSLALAATMSFPAFAENTAANDGKAGTDITVNGTYKAGADAGEVISVDIAWEAMDFTYTAPSKGTWNPGTHEYENATAGSWAPSGDADPKITVTNHSNIPVKAGFNFTAGVSGLDGLFSKNTLFLDTAENTAFENAPNGETTFSLAGEGINATQSVGTITVTVENGITEISTAEELLNTRNKDGYFKLANDITLDDAFHINSENYILDLNGHTLQGSHFSTFVMIEYAGKVVIKNGTVLNTNDGGYGTAVEILGGKDILFENCDLSSYSTALSVYVDSAVRADSCNFKSTREGSFVIINLNELTLSGETFIVGKGGLSNQGGAVKVLSGNYNFNPTEYVDLNLYDVTEGTIGGLWAVTSK